MAAQEKYSKVGSYILMQTIGVGSFGKVKLAVHEKTHERYACKVIDKRLVRERTLSVNKEISIMRRLRHFNTVSLVGVLSTTTKVFIIMELVTGGELFSEIERHRRLTEEYARFYFHQLVEGVEHCHQHGIYHRDLKPENLLLDENSTLKISDFGLSAFKVNPKESDPDSVTGSLTLHTQCGTPNYVAPEIITLDADGYSGARADVWSCGIILYVLVAGALPFDANEMDALFKLIVQGDPEFPEYFSDDLKDLITGMLQRKPEKRLTLFDVRCHRWFHGRIESCMPGGTPPTPSSGHPKLTRDESKEALASGATTDPSPSAHNRVIRRLRQEEAPRGDSGTTESDVDQSTSRDPASPSFKSSAPSCCSSSSSSSSSHSRITTENVARKRPGARPGTVSPLATYVMGSESNNTQNVKPSAQSLLPKDSLDVSIQAHVVPSEIDLVDPKPPSESDDEGSDQGDDYYDEDARNVSDYTNNDGDEYQYMREASDGMQSTDDVGTVYSGNNAVSQRISLLEPFEAPSEPQSTRDGTSYYRGEQLGGNTMPNDTNLSDESDVTPTDEKRTALTRFRERAYDGNSDSSVQSSDDDHDHDHYEEAKEVPYSSDFQNPAPVNGTTQSLNEERRARSVESMERNPEVKRVMQLKADMAAKPKVPANYRDLRRQLWDREANAWRPSAQSYHLSKQSSAAADAEKMRSLASEVEALFASDSGKQKVKSKAGSPSTPPTSASNKEGQKSSSHSGSFAVTGDDSLKQGSSHKQTLPNAGTINLNSTPRTLTSQQRQLSKRLERERRQQAEKVRRLEEYNISSQRYAATNNSWVNSSAAQMVWSRMMKDFDLIPDHIEFGIPSEELSDLWEKGLAAEGLGPKKSFMDYRFGPIPHTPTRSSMYITPGSRANLNDKKALRLRRERLRHAARHPENLRRPFPPNVQEKLERLSGSNRNSGANEEQGSETHPNKVAHKQIRDTSKDGEQRQGRDSNKGILRNGSLSEWQGNSQGDNRKDRGKGNVVTFATNPDIVIDRTNSNGINGTNSHGTALPMVDSPTSVLSNDTSTAAADQMEYLSERARTGGQDVSLTRGESPLTTVKESRAVHMGKDPLAVGELAEAVRSEGGERMGSRRDSPLNQSFSTSSSGGSGNSAVRNEEVSDRRDTTVRADRRGPPLAPQLVPLAGSGTLSSGTSGTGGGTGGHGSSQSGSDTVVWSSERAGSTESGDGGTHQDGRRDEEEGDGRQNEEEASTERSGKMRERKSGDRGRGVTSISKVSPFELNIPSPKGTAPPSNHVLNRVPSVTSRLFGRRETTTSQSPKSRWQFQTVRGVEETYELVSDVLGTVGMTVQKKSGRRRIRALCEWSDGASGQAGVAVVIEAADVGGLSAVQVARSGAGRRASDEEMQSLFAALREAFLEQSDKMEAANRTSSATRSDDLVMGADADASRQSGGRFHLVRGRSALRRIAGAVHARA